VTTFGPKIDFYVLNAAPGAVFLEGSQAKVPLLSGWNELEELIYSPWELPHNTHEQYEEYSPLQYLNEKIEALSNPDLLPGSTDLLANTSTACLIGDLVIGQQAWQAVDT
jgi:hypothetical protein